VLQTCMWFLVLVWSGLVWLQRRPACSTAPQVHLQPAAVWSLQGACQDLGHGHEDCECQPRGLMSPGARHVSAWARVSGCLCNTVLRAALLRKCGKCC